MREQERSEIPANLNPGLDWLPADKLCCPDSELPAWSGSPPALYPFLGSSLALQTDQYLAPVAPVGWCQYGLSM